MLSSVKNFFLTFLLALVAFGLAAAAILSIAISNINGKLGGEGEETQVSSSGISGPGDVVPGGEDGTEGRSLNILIIGTDYREGMFADYDPELLRKLYGITPKKVREPAAPADVGVPFGELAGQIISDKEEPETGAIRTNEGTLIIENGFFSVPYRTVKADTAVLMRIDRERGQITYTAFPTDAYLTVSGRYCRMSEIYPKYGVQTLCDAVHMLTGVPVDRYLVITADGFRKAIDDFGGLGYAIAEPMKYDDYANNVHVDIPAGELTLDGQGALDLLMFDGYTNPAASREKTAVSFLRTLMARVFLPENQKKVPQWFEKLKALSETDLTQEDIRNTLQLAVNCSANSQEIGVITRNEPVLGDAGAAVFDTEATANVFARFKRIHK